MFNDLPLKLCSSSLTPLRSKLGDLADFFQRKLRNGDLLRLRSLRLNVPDSEALPPFGAFYDVYNTRFKINYIHATYTHKNVFKNFRVISAGESQKSFF